MADTATGVGGMRIRWTSVLFGGLAGLGFLVLLQQYSVTTLTTAKLIWVPILSALLGGLMGISAPAIEQRRKGGAS
jgi:hypothetical protein